MTAYEETRHQIGDSVNGEMVIGVPDRYDLWLAPVDGALNYVRVDPESDNPSRFVVLDIPATVRPTDVALHLKHIAIWPHPDELLWSAVADLPRGTLLRGLREGDAIRSPQISHWSGAACIGWMRGE